MRVHILPAVAAVIGAQLLFTGAILPGIFLLGFAVQKGRPWPPMLLAAAICLGMCSGIRERALTLEPPVPRGQVVVQAGDWQLKPGYVTYRGVAANGVPVTGGLPVSQRELRELQDLDGPVLLDWEKSSRISGPTNLYEFDYAAYSWAQYHAAYRLRSKRLRFSQVETNGLVAQLQRLRVAITGRIALLPARVGAYTRALLLGSMDGEMATMRDTFSRLGILHLFSVSGLHIFALVGIIYAASNRLRIPSEYTDLVLLAALPLLLVIIPGGAGLIRAVWMRLLAIISNRLHWSLSTLDCFCMVLLLNSLYQPRVLFTLGGQMTYLLTFVLIVAPSAGNFRQSVNMALVSAAPLLSSVFGVHLLTFLFNWLLMPLFEIILMPLLFLFLIWPSCPLVPVTETALGGLDTVLTQMAKLPGFISVGALPGILALGVTIIVLRGLAIRRWRACVLAFGLVFLLLNFRPNWRVSCFDLGQGEAILIEAPFKRSTVLIDTGTSAATAGGNSPAKRIVLNYLAARGISKLDALVLSSSRPEYVGGAEDILRGIACKSLIISPAARKIAGVERAAAKQKIPVHVADGDVGSRIGPVDLSLFPDSSRGQALQIYAKLGTKKYFFAGAASGNAQKRLRALHLDADYLQVGRHGAASGFDAQFMRSSSPSAGLVLGKGSFAAANPSTDIFKQFAKLPAPVFATQEQGMIYAEQTRGNTQLHTYRQNK